MPIIFLLILITVQRIIIAINVLLADEQVQYTWSTTTTTTTTTAVTSSLVSSTATTSTTASVGVQPTTPAGKRVYAQNNSTTSHSQYNIQIIFMLDVQYVSEAYRIDFEHLESEFVQLFIDVTEIIEKDETVTMANLKQFLSRFHDLKASLAKAYNYH